MKDILIPVPENYPVDSRNTENIEYELYRHEYVVVMNPDCDLEWDFIERFPDDESRYQYYNAAQVEKTSALVPSLFLCDAYTEQNVRHEGGRGLKADLWKRVKQNQDIRYHHLPSSSIGSPESGTLPDLFLDFKQTQATSSIYLYNGLNNGSVQRIGLIPAIYVHDLIQRYYCFLSRVGLPD